MSETFEFVEIWFLALGKEYGVNPIIFGSIYLGAIPFFMASVAWLYNNYKKKKSVIIPSVCATGCFISAYLYLMVVGQNVPWWIYGAVIGMIAYGGYSTVMNVRKKVTEIEKEEMDNGAS